MNPLNRLYKLKCHYDLHGLTGRTKRMLCEDVCHTTSDVKVISICTFGSISRPRQSTALELFVALRYARVKSTMGNLPHMFESK